MVPMTHPILYQRPSLLGHTEKPDDYDADYIAFPKGKFDTIRQVIWAEPVSYIRMKGQFLEDIGRLKSLTQRLIGDICDEDITIFHQKIINDLRGEDETSSSLISFQDTRYYLHKIVDQTERFLELEAQNPGEADKFAFNKDGFCAYFVEFLSGINHCLNGSGSRIQSAFISLENSRDPQKELYKIRHGILEYGVKSFLAKEHANGQAEYCVGDEVHWHNALYNIACDRFGLEPMNDPRATLGDDTEIIGRLERILPSLMPEFEILHKFTEVFYQDLVFALKKRNKEDWLIQPVSGTELTSEIIDGIKEDFITPINLRFKTKDASKLDLWTIIKPCDDGSYEFSQSRERLQVWLIDHFLNSTPGANVFYIVDKKSYLESFWDLFTKIEDDPPLLCIGSKDNLYFWAFNSEAPLVEGAHCNLDWDNHQTLTLGHLKTVNFYSFPKEIRFNLLHHALNHSNKPGDFFEFFLNQTASRVWKKTVESYPQIKEMLLEKLIQIMNDEEVFVRELTTYLKSPDTGSPRVYASHFFNDVLSQASKLKKMGVIVCLARYDLCKNLTEFVEYQRLLFSTLMSDPEQFKTLCQYPLIDFNSNNEKGEMLLVNAAGNGQTECLKVLLKQKGINANLPDKSGWTPLMVAARYGHGDCVEVLLDHNVLSINAKNNDGYTALMLAARGGNERCARLLLQQPDIDILATNKDGKNVWSFVKAGNAAERHPWQTLPQILDAANNGDLASLTELLNFAGALIHVRNQQGLTPAMLAAKSGHVDCLKTILAKKAIDVNNTENSGKTALMLAAENGQTGCLKELLTQPGIDLNAQSNHGWTAIMFAATKGQTQCLKLLLKKNEIRANYPDKEGWTPLMAAARYGHGDCVQALLEHYVCARAINEKNRNGFTALMLAVIGGDERCTLLLLQQTHIYINLTNTNGANALMLAAENGRTECLMMLLKRKEINANLSDKNGWTPLMKAARHGHGDCVQVLLEHDASSINAQNNNGSTALMLAADEGDERCASLLLQQPDIDICTINKDGKNVWSYVESGDAARRHPWQTFPQILVAADNGDLALLTELLNFARALIHVRDGERSTLAMLAAKNGHVDCLEAILARKIIDVNRKDKKGNTALMLAAKNGQAQCLEKLLAQDEIEPNAHNNDGRTALTIAASEGQTKCLKVLLKKNGIHANLPDKANWTPLMAAARYGHEDCVEVLLEHDKSSLNAKNNDNYTALMVALRNGYERCALLLLRQTGIDINTASKGGITALMLATEKGQTEIIKGLLAKEGIKLNAQDNNLCSAVMYAAVNGQTECLKMLLEQPEIEASLLGMDDWTPLMAAATYGHGDCVEVLLKHNVSPINAQNKHGYTALMLAANHQHWGCLQLLADHNS
ncbi:ankyrin repeat domain-containing protein [Endozoicomonas sp. YOMI1]|uniref:ankyrin repeat domain-containing protein n=1 Tax=Endozoicomonas sp. YOMI1 TaxID=2828739 RepID=UPI0021483219|nr:ankyrin repeat domain-containing protein [Endozoicomonas sp. YOMI1]